MDSSNPTGVMYQVSDSTAVIEVIEQLPMKLSKTKKLPMKVNLPC